MVEKERVIRITIDENACSAFESVQQVTDKRAEYAFEFVSALLRAMVGWCDAEPGTAQHNLYQSLVQENGILDEIKQTGEYKAGVLVKDLRHSLIDPKIWIDEYGKISPTEKTLYDKVAASICRY